MNIKEIYNDYDEVWPMSNPVGGKKAYDGLALAAGNRMKAMGKAAAMAVSTIGVVAMMAVGALGGGITAHITGCEAGYVDAAVFLVVDAEEGEEETLTYIVTDAEGNTVTQGEISATDTEISLEGLADNTDYTITIYDRDGNPQDTIGFTTEEIIDGVPVILSLQSSYDRLTNTVTVTAEIQTNDAKDLAPALTAAGFDIAAADVVIGPEADGVVTVTYTGKHELEEGEYDVFLSVGYTENETSKSLKEASPVYASDLVIKGFSGKVENNKSITLDAIATHSYTDTEPYEIRSVAIVAKRLATGNTFNVAATHQVNGDTINIDASTGVLAAGKYRFDLTVNYTINNTDTPVLTATAQAIELTVPTTQTAYKDLELLKNRTELAYVYGQILMTGAVTTNDAKSLSGTMTVELPETRLTLPLRFGSVSDGEQDMMAQRQAALTEGTYPVTITVNYTLNGASKSKSMSLELTVEGESLVDLEIDRENTAISYGDYRLLLEGIVIPNDATDVTGELSILGLDNPLVYELLLDTYDDGTMSISVDEKAELPPGTYTATITVHYMLGDEERTKELALELVVEAVDYEDLVIDEENTALSYSSEQIALEGIVIPNDAENLSGTMSLPALQLSGDLTFGENTDNACTMTSAISVRLPAGNHPVEVTVNYTLGGEEMSQTVSMRLFHGGLNWTEHNTYGSADNNGGFEATANIGFGVAADDIDSSTYSIDSVTATLYNASQAEKETQAVDYSEGDYPDEFYAYAEFTGQTGESYHYISFSVTYTIGSGDAAYTETVTSDLLRVDLPKDALNTTPPRALMESVSKSGSGATMSFTMYPNGSSETANHRITIDGVEASAAGYTVTDQIEAASGTISVTGPFDGLKTVTLEFDFRRPNSSEWEAGTAVSATLDAGYFEGFTFSNVSVSWLEGDSTVEGESVLYPVISGYYSSDNTASALSVVSFNCNVFLTNGNSRELTLVSHEPAADGKSGSFVFDTTTYTMDEIASCSLYLVADVSGVDYSITVTGEYDVPLN